MDKGLRVVGFTFSNSESTTLSAEVSNEVFNVKLQTQRSLLSELLAIRAEGDDGLSNFLNDNADDDDENYYATEEAVQAVQADTFVQTPSCPIPIPCPKALANQRAKDACRRRIYQCQAERYYQQQQQLQYQHYQAQQLLWIQQQQQLQLQLQHQAALSKHAQQEHDVDLQSRGQIPTVPVY